MILVIDNYDSSTHNLVQCFGELDCRIEVHRNDRITAAEIRQKAPTHLVLSPGFGPPEKAGVSLDAVRTCLGHMSILGIGVGLQAIAVAFGGRIVRAQPVHGQTSEICHDGRTLFQGLEYRFRATRYHALVVDRDLIPAALDVSATTPDGVIMGLRHRQYSCEGVQFHPESIMTLPGKWLIRNFLGVGLPT